MKKHKPRKRNAVLITAIILLCGALTEIGIAQSVLFSTVLVILYYAVAWVNEH